MPSGEEGDYNNDSITASGLDYSKVSNSMSASWISNLQDSLNVSHLDLNQLTSEQL